MKCEVRIDRPNQPAIVREVEDGRSVEDVLRVVRSALRDEMARRPGECIAIVLSAHPLGGCEHEPG